METLETDILVVGGGTGGTVAAIQAARRGVQTVLVSEFAWLGGMLTSAGVSAPDGNELAAFQTGMWGEFLRSLQRRQSGGLDNGWVSFFTFDPRLGARIFAEWARSLPNLTWIAGQVPREVLRQGDRITGVRFETLTVRAQITLDGTELGDLLPLADVPYRWGWEWQSEWDEPSAPTEPTPLTERYPVQVPTWVVLLRDFGEGERASEIPPPPNYNPDRYFGAWDGYAIAQFLNYGRLPGDTFMLNWPQRGNDYGERLNRLVESETARSQFCQEARWHAQGFAYFIQSQLGRRYGLAEGVFPANSAFAEHPYYRESRRIRGVQTLCEGDLLPIAGGRVAKLPPGAIAIGNYANDHHYPDGSWSLHSKSLRWGGRVTGTPFAIPYGCLVPATIDGLLACEKNISVSHIANGATRLQPAVMNIGQAAGMAAALCVERGVQPRELPVRVVQAALWQDPIAPAATVPLFDLDPHRPDWLHWQRYYRDRPDCYPASGEVGGTAAISANRQPAEPFDGIFTRCGEQSYTLMVEGDRLWTLVTLRSTCDRAFKSYPTHTRMSGWGRWNRAGNWLLVEAIDL